MLAMSLGSNGVDKRSGSKHQEGGVLSRGKVTFESDMAEDRKLFRQDFVDGDTTEAVQSIIAMFGEGGAMVACWRQNPQRPLVTGAVLGSLDIQSPSSLSNSVIRCTTHYIRTVRWGLNLFVSVLDVHGHFRASGAAARGLLPGKT